MRTFLVVVVFWAFGGLLAALVFGHLAHRAAVRSPALERALLELTGLRLPRTPNRRLLAAVIAVSMVLLVVVGANVESVRRPSPGSALGPASTESPNPSGALPEPKRAEGTRAFRSRTPQRPSVVDVARVENDAPATKRSAKFVLALRSAASAGSVGLFRAAAQSQRPRRLHVRALHAKHVKRHGRAQGHGRAK